MDGVYLEALHVLHLGELVAALDARLEERGRHRHADGLRGHARVRAVRRRGHGSEGAEEEHEEVLRDQRQ